MKHLTAKEIRRGRFWNCFPRRYRRRYLAQGGLCPYCGQAMPLTVRQSPRRPTRDHIMPKVLGGSNAGANIALAHQGCNEKKGGRAPRACEILFGAITEDIRRTFYRSPTEVA